MNLNKVSILINLSGVCLAIALAMMAWVVIGAVVAPSGKSGAFDSLMWPAVATVGAALLSLLAAKWVARREPS